MAVANSDGAVRQALPFLRLGIEGMRTDSRYALLLALLCLLLPSSSRAGELPGYLPHYVVEMDLDLPRHFVTGRILATWTNPHARPTNHLVFNAHSHYFVPSKDIPLMAKTLEILHVNPSEALITKKTAFDVVRVSLPPVDGKPDEAGAASISRTILKGTRTRASSSLCR